MTTKQAIQLFQERKVHTAWDDQKEKWNFPIADVCTVLTDVADTEQLFRIILSIPSPKRINNANHFSS